MAALRAVEMPQQTRDRLEQILVERDASFDTPILDLAGQIRWLCATGDLEAMTALEFLINEDEIINPIRALGMLMMSYYGRGDLVHDQAIRDELTEAEHAELKQIYDGYAQAWIAQCRVQVEAGAAAGLEFSEHNARDGNLHHILRMKDFVRKARASIARQLGATEPDLPERLKSADIPSDAFAQIEPQLESFAAADADQRIELFWNVLLTLTHEQAMRVIEALRPDAGAERIGQSRRQPAERIDG